MDVVFKILILASGAVGMNYFTYILYKTAGIRLLPTVETLTFHLLMAASLTAVNYFVYSIYMISSHTT